MRKQAKREKRQPDLVIMQLLFQERKLKNLNNMGHKKKLQSFNRII